MKLCKPVLSKKLFLGSQGNDDYMGGGGGGGMGDYDGMMDEF